MDTLAIQDTFEPYYDGQHGSRRRVVGKRPGTGAVTKSGEAAPANNDGASKPADFATAQATEH